MGSSAGPGGANTLHPKERSLWPPGPSRARARLSAGAALQYGFLSSITMEMVTNGVGLLTRFLGACLPSRRDGGEATVQPAVGSGLPLPLPMSQSPWGQEPPVSQDTLAG